MKTVTVRESYHNAALVDGLPPGRQLVVTTRGRPKFVVTKGARPRMDRKLAEARSVGDPKGPKVDSLRVLLSLKK